ncbi:carbohydrate kinase family protein [bacterium]|nr:carbohydrate kinase family protein [bacterium]
MGVDFLCVGVLVNDVREPVSVRGVNLREGSLKVVGGRPVLSKKHIESSTFGGGGNVVLPAKALGVKTGVLGYVGNDYGGEYYINGMERFNINTGGIIKTKWNTDTTIVTKRTGGKRGPLAFFEDAGKYLDMTEEVKEKILTLNPKIVQIIYSGLFENGFDRNGGRNLARFIQWLREIGVMVMVDTHTYVYRKEKYDLLRPSLKAAHFFMCSNDEVELMQRQYNIPGSWESDEISKAYSFLEYFERTFWNKVEEARIFAVTAKDYVIIKYCTPKKGVITRFLENYFSSIKASDTVGAGDAFRAGFNVYVIKNLKRFKRGTMDINEAVQMANLTALLYIGGKETDAFKSYTFMDLLRLVREGKPKKPYRNLNRLYSIMDTFE